MKTILVTGNQGQLAQCIQSEALKHNNCRFNFKSSSELDITDKIAVGKIFNEIKFDYLINCAAYTAVDKAETEIEKAYKVNAIGVENLATQCKKHQTIFIHISTDFVFDGYSTKPYKENDVTCPLGAYGKTKLDGENKLIEILENYFIIRTSWLYSEYGNNFVKTMRKLANEKEEIGVVDDQIGCPTYARDLAVVLLKIVEVDYNAFGTYHYSNLGKASWYDFAEEILRLSNNKVQLKKIKTIEYQALAKRPKFSVLDTSKIHKALNLQIPHWKMSLAKCVSNCKNKNNLSLAIEAALMAGKAIMKVYDSTLIVEYKEDKSPLTKADLKSNSIISSHLKKTDIPIISEENKQADFATRKNWDTCWIVDPLDGTKEFIKQNGEFTVNIALVKHGKPILGVIYVPVTKTLYYAIVKDGNASKVSLNKHQTEVSQVFSLALVLKNVNQNINKVRIIGSRSHMNKDTKDYIEGFKQMGKDVEVVTKGSSLKFCMMAEGNAEIYPRFAPTMEWDTAAGQAICNAVGIEVRSLETNQPLRYNKINLQNPFFIAR